LGGKQKRKHEPISKGMKQAPKKISPAHADQGTFNHGRTKGSDKRRKGKEKLKERFQLD